MALYFKDIEITNIDNLVPQTGLDITELWFGSMNIYTVWEIYEGTLPATIYANGDDMRQYQIYGANGGVGDRTVQLFDKNATDTDNGYVSGAYIKSDGELQNSSTWFVSEYIPVNAEEQYTIVYGSIASSRAVCYYDISKNYISGANYSGLSAQETITTPPTCAYMRLSLVLSEKDTITVTPGTTPPETYVPFGYEVDMGVKSGNLLCATATNTVNGNEVSVSTIQNSSDFIINAATTVNRSITVPLNITLSAGTYTLSVYGLHIVTDAFDRCNIRDTNGNYYGTSLTTPASPKTFTTQEEVTINRLSFVIYEGEVYDNEKIGVCLVRGAVAPTKYQPYSNTTTPIYIGDELLEEDEYVDYQAGKVYRINNLWDITAEDFENSSIVSGEAKGYIISGLKPNTDYTLSSNIPRKTNAANLWFNGGSTVNDGVWNGNSRTSTSNENGEVIIYYRKTELTNYEEYWYRLVETLNPYLPTDPPVPLPTLPTCEGETVVDYAGQSVVPEKAMFKYRKEGF